MKKTRTLLLTVLAVTLLEAPVRAVIDFTDVTSAAGTGLPGALTESLA
jgi:hypothetical protein